MATAHVVMLLDVGVLVMSVGAMAMHVAAVVVVLETTTSHIVLQRVSCKLVL